MRVKEIRLGSFLFLLLVVWFIAVKTAAIKVGVLPFFVNQQYVQAQRVEATEVSSNDRNKNISSNEAFNSTIKLVAAYVVNRSEKDAQFTDGKRNDLVIRAWSGRLPSYENSPQIHLLVQEALGYPKSTMLFNDNVSSGREESFQDLLRGVKTAIKRDDLYYKATIANAGSQEVIAPVISYYTNPPDSISEYLFVYGVYGTGETSADVSLSFVCDHMKNGKPISRVPIFSKSTFMKIGEERSILFNLRNHPSGEYRIIAEAAQGNSPVCEVIFYHKGSDREK